MAVKVSKPRDHVEVVNGIWYRESLQEALAASLIADMAESSVEMMKDMPSEYTSFEAVESAILTSREAALDVMRDYINMLEESLEKKIRECTIVVDAVKFSKEGVVDADVTVS